jgi:type II secretory pathway pseudopilin PulG
MKKYLKQLPAFALLEVAIALCVLGVVTYMGMPLLGKLQYWQAARVTNDHQTQVMHALGGYVLANKRLPCPAANANGEALSVCTNETNAGFVPFKTLGIPEKIAKDGHNHWMTYVVEPSLTSNRINWIQPPELEVDPSMVLCTLPSSGNIKLLDGSGHPCIMPPDFTAIVLIAHGNSGGFYLDNGSIQPTNSTDPDKSRNTNRSDVYVTKSFKVSAPEIFDDTILFASRNNLMAMWAKYPCQKSR